MSDDYSCSPGARRKVSDPLGRLSDISSGSSFGSNPGSPRLLPRRGQRPTQNLNLGGSRRHGSNSSLVEGMHSLDSGVSEWERSASPSRLAGDSGWAEKCFNLQMELHRTKHHAAQVRDILQDKLTELQQRVVEAEERALEAETKMRLMEKAAESSSNKVEPADAQRVISKLETQVEEQRRLRLQDAKQVEAKAAKIKEWVTNKLRGLEEQNQQLREQNLRCNQQIELLRNHLEQLSLMKANVPVMDGEIEGSRPISAMSNNAPVVTRRQSDISRDSADDSLYADLRRSQHGTSSLGSMSSRLSQDVRDAMDELTFVPDCVDELTHDYAEIYTPSKEKLPWKDITSSTTSLASNGGEPPPPKPPTPPLHRYPSWESKLYQIAANGFSLSPGNSLHSSPILKHMTNSLPFDRMGRPGHNSPQHNSLPHNLGLKPLKTSLTVAPSVNISHAVSIESQPVDSSCNNVLGASLVSGGEKQSIYCDISVPVYATVKGRASQIRSVPFTGDSSDDSSDGEDHSQANNTRAGSNCSSSEDTSVSGGSNSMIKTCSLSPTKNRDTSFESGVSEDYAIPPDALSSTSITIDTSMRSSCLGPDNRLTCPDNIEKTGHLTKLGGKLKTWRKRWFVLRDGALKYWKSQSDVYRKPAGEIKLDERCRITRAEGAATFEITAGRKTMYLTADSISQMEEWLRVLLSVQRRQAALTALSREEQRPTLQSWLTKVKNGHPRRCYCVLLGKMFFYYNSPTDKKPAGEINMRDARVEEVEQSADSDTDEPDKEGTEYTIGIFPANSGPTYLLIPNKQEKDSWLYHLTIVSGGSSNAGTQFEQIVQKLMEVEGDANCVLWRHPIILYTKDCITAPLTTLSSESLQTEAVKLFKSCQLFMSAALEQAGIDYHVVLAQNALQLCIDQPELQAEMMCGLVKQTSRPPAHKQGVQVKGSVRLKHPRQYLLCATQSLFSCDSQGGSRDSNSTSSSSQTKVSSSNCVQASCDPSKGCPTVQVLQQGWQLLALACSLFIPKNNKLLWFLKLHIHRNADSKTECGKYAAYCDRALSRTLQNGGRQHKPSRMEVLSILLKNPYHHSLPHAIPVHMLNGAYQVVSFDGSTTVDEFLFTLCHEIGCRESNMNGFTLFSDDPIEKNLQHFIPLDAKLCDVISKWETALREKGSGKFENSRVIQLVYRSRLYFKLSCRTETDRERLLLCYQTNQQIVLGRFPLTKELALELAALMSQIEYGEYSMERSQGRTGNLTLTAIDKFYPYRYRDGLTQQRLKELQDELTEKWQALKGRSVPDCVRIYLTCVRKWPFFGASLFQAKWKNEEGGKIIWLAVGEDALTLLDLQTMSPLFRHAYTDVVTFGGCQDDLMVVVSTHKKLLFAMSKPKILELTLLVADYMNAMGRNPGTPQLGSLSRRSLRKPGQQPDILKSTPDQHTVS